MGLFSSSRPKTARRAGTARSPLARPPQQAPGLCLKTGCDEQAGHGPKNALCAAHAALAGGRAEQIIRRAAPQQMMMHEGPPVTLPCGHAVHPGDHVVSHGGRWTCENCALGR